MFISVLWHGKRFQKKLKLLPTERVHSIHPFRFCLLDSRPLHFHSTGLCAVCTKQGEGKIHLNNKIGLGFWMLTFYILYLKNMCVLYAYITFTLYVFFLWASDTIFIGLCRYLGACWWWSSSSSSSYYFGITQLVCGNNTQKTDDWIYTTVFHSTPHP